MIQSSSKDITLIVYNAPKAPRCIKINKKLTRFLFISIPTLFVISISLSFLYSLKLKNTVNVLKLKEPKLILDLRTEQASLKQELAQSKNTLEELTQKLTLGSSNSPATNLGLFTTPIGMKDLTAENSIRIEDMAVKNISDKEIQLKFNLLNNAESGKVSGHISIIQYQNGLIQFYPEYNLPENNLRLIFSEGETFTASRFRPVLANFKKLSNLSTKYKVYIFSRSGDLLFYKQIGPFNIE